MKFQVNVCPLCGKSCRLHKIAGVTFFSCPIQSADFPTFSHYQVRCDLKTEIQHILIYPYSIDSFADTYKSRVYHSTGLQEDGRHKLKLLMETSLIRAENESKLLERLNKLVTFL